MVNLFTNMLVNSNINITENCKSSAQSALVDAHATHPTLVDIDILVEAITITTTTEQQHVSSPIIQTVSQQDTLIAAADAQRHATLTGSTDVIFTLDPNDTVE